MSIAVAPSCVDPSLLVAVLDAVPRLTPPDGISSVGYNALDDSIDVIGVNADALVNALDGKDHNVGALARIAIVEGTLRVR